MVKTVSVLLVSELNTGRITKDGVCICSYYNSDNELVRGIGIEYSDVYPDLPMVVVTVPEPQI